jgi:hypothetical protein
MKRLILSSLIIPLAVLNGYSGGYSESTILAEVRKGDWPISLEKTVDRSGTSYSLQFRDEQEMNAVVLDTLPFPNLEQLRYLEKALTTLKTANDGDIATFKDYSVKRTVKKYEGVFYILRYQWGSTDFRQPEADIIINAIRKQ